MAHVLHTLITPDGEHHVIAQFTEDKVGVGEVFH